MPLQFLTDKIISEKIFLFRKKNKKLYMWFLYDKYGVSEQLFKNFFKKSVQNCYR